MSGMAKGRIIVNTGDGKGKTTAALGTALRAAGHDQQVAIVQFIKGAWNYGEGTAFERFPNVDLVRFGSGFTWEAEDPSVPLSLAREAWAEAQKRALSDRYNLLVLDELNYAVALGYVSADEVLELLAQKPQRLSVIITGRDAAPELIEAADTVTEMRCMKHGFAEGLPAKKGIEY
jgi:cob(I)alamin adenosyltransferase